MNFDEDVTIDGNLDVIGTITSGTTSSKKSFLLVDPSYSTGQQQFVIRIPCQKTGNYTITLYSGDVSDPEIDGFLLFSFNVQKVGDTMNITYGRVNESISEFYVHKDGSIYIKTRYGRKLYYTTQTIGDRVIPETYGEYPGILPDDYIYYYVCVKEHSNIYTSWDGIDILNSSGGESTNLGRHSLAVTSTDNINKVSNYTVYSPYSGDKIVYLYKPDQNLNTDSQVVFSTIKLPTIIDSYIKTDSSGNIVKGELREDFTSHEDFNNEIALRTKGDNDNHQYSLSLYETLNSKIDTTFDTLNDVITKEGSDTLDKAKEYSDSEDSKLETLISNNASNISSETNRATNAENSLQQKIDDLLNTIESLTSRIESLEANLTAVQSSIKDLSDTKQDSISVTSPITLNGATIGIDESELVHKSGEETITGDKTITGVMTFSGNAPVVPTSTPTNSSTLGAIWISKN